MRGVESNVREAIFPVQTHPSIRDLPAPPPQWRERWPTLARALGISAREPVILGLSGGADSVLLLHWLHAAEETPVTAVHVHHGLRGSEADDDAQYCRELCRALAVPFRLRRVELAAAHGSLEEAARKARYDALFDEARSARVRVLVTAHHADDALEGVLMRWVRGSELPGLVGPQRDAQRCLPGGGTVRLARPLLTLRREEIRRLLESAGLGWREDSSNVDARFTRSRVRNQLLPRLSEVSGAEGLEHLRNFARAVEDLERDLSERTAQLAWAPLRGVSATRRREDSSLGGALPRSRLRTLPRALRRRALWRLLVEATQHAPSRDQLDRIVGELDDAACARHGLRGGWQLRLSPSRVELHPPLEALLAARAGEARQLRLSFAEAQGAARTAPWVASLAAPEHGFVLPAPGSVTLPDGRRVFATLIEADAGRAIPREPGVVELDARDLPTNLRVRWPAPGDRFHPLGARGTRALRRFLADAGVPARERRLVPLVFAGDELLWVAGLRPAHPRRVSASTGLRLRLELHSGPQRRSARDEQEPAPRKRSHSAARGAGEAQQLELFEG